MLDEIETILKATEITIPSWARALAPQLFEARAISGVRDGKLRVFGGCDARLVMVDVPEAIGLSRAGLRACVCGALRSLLVALREHEFPHPVRMWTFIPGIHGAMGEGVDRYRVFNMGRFDAFTEWLGQGSPLEGNLPSASAVGHGGRHLLISVLGLERPGMPVENPRQRPAFGYSRAHGPRPPCFSRAVLASLPGGARLLVSGTASIRGEDSMHPGMLDDQLDETFANLDQLARSVPGPARFSLSGIETARVYFPRTADRATLVSGVSSRIPVGAAVEYVPAFICRPELLVEIETTLAPNP